MNQITPVTVREMQETAYVEIGPGWKVRQCGVWESYGCPGGVAGDEFAPPVDVQCPSPAVWLHAFPSYDKPGSEWMALCDHHKQQVVDQDRKGQERKEG